MTLKIFNMLGQVVASLEVGVQNGGEHELQFDARGLASGVYFYRILAGEWAAARRFVLLR